MSGARSSSWSTEVPVRIEVLRLARITAQKQLDSLERLENREQREDEEGERAPADELAALVDD